MAKMPAGHGFLCFEKLKLSYLVVSKQSNLAVLHQQKLRRLVKIVNSVINPETSRDSRKNECKMWQTQAK